MTIAPLALFFLGRRLVAAAFRRFQIAWAAVSVERHLRAEVALVLQHLHMSGVEGLLRILLLITLVNSESASLPGSHAVDTTGFATRVLA